MPSSWWRGLFDRALELDEELAGRPVALPGRSDGAECVPGVTGVVGEVTIAARKRPARLPPGSIETTSWSGYCPAVPSLRVAAETA